MDKKAKVLVIDDDQTLLSMYQERLRMEGYEIETASNGEEGLLKIQEEKPDLVLLDIMLPKVNGFDILATLRSAEETKDLPIIMLSALTKEINKSKTLQIGANDYILKSEIMPADLIVKIEQVLNKDKK